MAEYHCGALMEHTPIPMKSGRIQHDFRCKYCGQEFREIRNGRGVLWRWINLTLKRRLEAAST